MNVWKYGWHNFILFRTEEEAWAEDLVAEALEEDLVAEALEEDLVEVDYRYLQLMHLL